MSKNKKLPAINYTSRDFRSIKNDLVNYAKRYYPDTYQDFSEASFGSMMVDMTAYVGDVMSFYLDYQVNESFLDSAIDTRNVNRLAKQLGYRRRGAASSEGIVTLYVLIPASTTGVGPDKRYAPILRAGTKFGAENGSVFTLMEDVDFGKSENDLVVATTNSTTGLPTKYAIRTSGRVKSGELKVEYISAGEYQRFPKFFLDGENITEIVSVVDSSGNKYYEVEYLTQDTVYFPVTNPGPDKDTVPSIMKPRAVPRRYIVEHLNNRTSIQFGYGSDDNITSEVISEPAKVILDMHGKNYVSDTSFDPTKLIETDKLGVAPSNTTLTVVYRSNGPNSINISTDSLDTISDVDIKFKNSNALSSDKIRDVISSLEFENEEPIVGATSAVSSEEVKQRAYGIYAAQNRAVTKEDYKALIFNMPARFGSVKRINIAQDRDSFKRNLNLYIVSENASGRLITSPSTLKKNLKTWITNYKMINDTIDILDGKIVNLSIKYEVMVDREENRFRALNLANRALARKYTLNHFDFGEPLYISDIFQVLKNIPSVLDVGKVEVVQQTGAAYSDVEFNVDSFVSPDQKMIIPPEDYIFEIKFASEDIVGSIM
tara:strand:+ start:312 stop:2114 length:1803 start_codon:yes stop_codon:yes gene_type:complete